MERDNGKRDRSTNLLSEAGSRYGDDEIISHYGQSEYGGASNIGLQEPSYVAEQPKSIGSRRQ